MGLCLRGGGLPGEEREGKKNPRSRHVRRAHGSYDVLPRQAYEADLRMLPEDGWRTGGTKVSRGQGNVTSILRSDT